MSDYIGPCPLNQYFDDNGLPLAGGLLYSYVAGTSTPQPTYMTAGAPRIPNRNPQVLDASGRALFYIPAGVGYKFNLLTAGGVPVTGYPIDNYMIPAVATPPAPAAVPTGAILPYGGSSAPTAYLLCDHAAVDRATYAALFSVIGTTYGAGDGTTTFNLPDMRGMFPLGKSASGTGSTLGATGGLIDHTHTYTDVVNHTHTVTDPGHVHSTGNFSAANAAGGGAVNALNGGGNTGSSVTGITVGNPSGGVASGTTAAQNPPFLVFIYIIKT